MLQETISPVEAHCLLLHALFLAKHDTAHMSRFVFFALLALGSCCVSVQCRGSAQAYIGPDECGGVDS